MKVQNFPDLEVPNIIITASLPGASPAQLETDVARKIENSIASLNGLKNIYTKVQDGSATITAEFRLEKPTQEALGRSALRRAASAGRFAIRRARPCCQQSQYFRLACAGLRYQQQNHGRRSHELVR